MKIRAFLYLLIGLWVINSPAYSKPAVPVSVSIVTQGEVITGQTVNFVVTVNSKVSAELLQINIHAPRNMKLESGQLNWRGGIQAGQPVKLEFSAILPERGQPIMAVAIIKGRGSASFMNRAIYHYSKAPVLNKQKPTSRQLYRDGRKIIEFPARMPAKK